MTEREKFLYSCRKEYIASLKHTWLGLKKFNMKGTLDPKSDARIKEEIGDWS